MVIAADTLLRGAQAKGERAKQLRLRNINWNLLARQIQCGATTVQYRHTEVIKLLLSHAKSLPWISYTNITRANLTDHIHDILDFEAGIPHQTDHAIPAFSRAQLQRRKRLQQITDAMACRFGDLEGLDVETRMVYFLLQSGKFTTPVLETLSGSQIRASVAYLYDQQSNKTTDAASPPRDLNRIEIDEFDLSDDEVSEYIC